MNGSGYDHASYDTVTISGRGFGAGQPCYVIAEIGISHNGDVDFAYKLISVAVNAAPIFE